MPTQDARIVSREAAEETYHDVEPHLESWVRWAQSRGLDPQEAQSIAHDSFLMAYRSYTTGRGATFVTFMGGGFKLGVKKTFAERQKRRQQAIPLEDVSESTPALSSSSKRSWETFRDSLPPDARVVAELAINPTIPIIMEHIEKGGHLHNFRTAIRTALREQGWSVDRIRFAIWDLVEALKSE